MFSDNNNNPPVSVIIPVYNGEKFIGRCLDSILMQTYGNMEVIIINDGSTDGTKSIIDSYCARHRNFRCIDKENSGAEEARNTGLCAATGKYIQYIDADDCFYDGNVISRLVHIAESHKADAVVSTFVFCEENGNSRQSCVPGNGTISGTGHIKTCLLNEYWALWTTFHLKSLYSGKFEKIGVCIGEDAVLLTQLMSGARTVVYSDKPAINYCIVPDSVSHTYSERFYSDFCKYNKWIENYLITQGIYPEVKKELAVNHIRMVTTLFGWNRMAETDKEMKQVLKEIHEFPDIQDRLGRRQKKLIKAYSLGRLPGRLFLSYYKHKRQDTGSGKEQE